MRRICLILALSLAVVACKGGQKPAQNATAGGEILQGSISDAMLPYDQVRSQPPLAPRPSGEAGKRGASDAAAADQTDAGPGEPPAVDVDTSGGADTTPDGE